MHDVTACVCVLLSLGGSAEEPCTDGRLPIALVPHLPAEAAAVQQVGAGRSKQDSTDAAMGLDGGLGHVSMRCGTQPLYCNPDMDLADVMASLDQVKQLLAEVGYQGLIPPPSWLQNVHIVACW